MRRIAVWVVAALMTGSGCQRSESAGKDAPDNADALDTRVARVNEALADTSNGKETDEPIARWLLPADLAEISGLAITPDGRLFAHNDETARVSQRRVHQQRRHHYALPLAWNSGVITCEYVSRPARRCSGF